VNVIDGTAYQSASTDHRPLTIVLDGRRFSAGVCPRHGYSLQLAMKNVPHLGRAWLINQTVVDERNRAEDK